MILKRRLVFASCIVAFKQTFVNPSQHFIIIGLLQTGEAEAIKTDRF